MTQEPILQATQSSTQNYSASEPILENLPPSLKSIELNEGELKKDNLGELENIETQLIKHLQSSSGIQATWKGVQLSSNDRFSIGEALTTASATADAFTQLQDAENEIIAISSVDALDKSWASEMLEANAVLTDFRQREKELIEAFLKSENKEEIFDYVVKISDQTSATVEIEKQLTEALS